jgi:hypothetical protein
MANVVISAPTADAAVTAQVAGCGLVLSCRRQTYQHRTATGAPIREVAMKNHSKPVRSMVNPEAPASKLPGKTQSEVKSAYWLAACSVMVSEDM